jgi:hypothetical protein
VIVLRGLAAGQAILAGLILLSASDFSCSTSGDSLGPTVSIEVSGVVRFVDVEGGCWAFRADDGTAYELVADKASSRILVDGARATLVLAPRKGAVSVCVVGRIAVVDEVKSLQLP